MELIFENDASSVIMAHCNSPGESLAKTPEVNGLRFQIRQMHIENKKAKKKKKKELQNVELLQNYSFLKYEINTSCIL